MAKRKRVQPWTGAFRQVRAVYLPHWRYPPKPTGPDLDAAEQTLGFRFPQSYRAFAEEYGLGGCLHGGLPHVLPLNRPSGAGKKDWFRSVVDATDFYRTHNWEYVSDATLLAFLRRAVVFAMDPGYHDWVFDPSEVTNKRVGEYQIYDVDRTTTVTTVALSFDQWLLRVGEDYRFEHEGEEEPSEPEFQLVYKPDSPCADPIDYVLDGLFKWKKRPAKRDAKRWLAWNANTVRNLARSIRDDGNTSVFPILADALEEAGCTNADLLGSCRTGDPDIDGVWVLQVLLGKA